MSSCLSINPHLIHSISELLNFPIEVFSKTPSCPRHWSQGCKHIKTWAIAAFLFFSHQSHQSSTKLLISHLNESISTKNQFDLHNSNPSSNTKNEVPNPLLPRHRRPRLRQPNPKPRSRFHRLRHRCREERRYPRLRNPSRGMQRAGQVHSMYYRRYCPNHWYHGSWPASLRMAGIFEQLRKYQQRRWIYLKDSFYWFVYNRARTYGVGWRTRESRRVIWTHCKYHSWRWRARVWLAAPSLRRNIWFELRLVFCCLLVVGSCQGEEWCMMGMMFLIFYWDYPVSGFGLRLSLYT